MESIKKLFRLTWWTRLLFIKGVIQNYVDKKGPFGWSTKCWFMSILRVRNANVELIMKGSKMPKTCQCSFWTTPNETLLQNSHWSFVRIMSANKSSMMLPEAFFFWLHNSFLPILDFYAKFELKLQKKINKNPLYRHCQKCYVVHQKKKSCR